MYKKIVKEIVNKVSTISLISKVVALSLVLATAPIGSIFANAQDVTNKAIMPNPEVSTDIKIKFSQAYPLYIDKRVVKSFNTVESEHAKVEREAREKTEAEQESQNNNSQEDNRVVTSRDYRPATVDPNLAEKRALVQRAAAAYNINWKILEAVWQVESGKSWDTTVASYAGAGGPMQFMPSTWSAYAVDGNGDGVANMYSAEDALYGAANMLGQNGLSSGDVDSALYNYNHAQWYVDMVKDVANSI